MPADRATETAALAAALALSALAFPVIAGGDWMPNRRLLVPALPLLAIAIALAVARRDRLEGRECRRATCTPADRRWALAAGALLFVEAAATSDHALDQRWRAHEHLDRRVERWSVAARPLREPYPLDWMPTHLMRSIAPYVAPGDAVAHVDVGQLPYVMRDVRFLDGFGLVDREAGRVVFSPDDPARRDEARAAFWTKSPAVLITVLDRESGRPFSAAHQAAMGDPRFAERYRELGRVPSWGEHMCVTFVRRDVAAATDEVARARIAAWLAAAPDVRPAF